MSEKVLPRRSVMTRLLDASAISLSGLCMVHCLALPIAAAFLPLLGAWAHADWVHVAFLAAAAPVSLVALGRSGAWRDARILLLALAGLLLLTMGVLGWPSEASETTVTVLGGLSLSLAHLINWKRHAHRH